VLNLKEFL